MTSRSFYRLPHCMFSWGHKKCLFWHPFYLKNSKRRYSNLQLSLVISTPLISKWKSGLSFKPEIKQQVAKHCGKEEKVLLRSKFSSSRQYSQLPLSRIHLSQIIKDLTTGNKELWKKGDIAPKEQFLLFSTILSIYISNFRRQITYSFVKYGYSIYFTSFLQIWYIEVRISRSISESPFEITSQQYFQYILTSGIKLHIHIKWFICPIFCKFDM